MQKNVPSDYPPSKYHRGVVINLSHIGYSHSVVILSEHVTGLIIQRYYHYYYDNILGSFQHSSQQYSFYMGLDITCFYSRQEMKNKSFYTYVVGVKGSTYSAGPASHVMSEVWLAMFVYLPEFRFLSNAKCLTCKIRTNQLSICYMSAGVVVLLEQYFSRVQVKIIAYLHDKHKK